MLLESENREMSYNPRQFYSLDSDVQSIDDCAIMLENNGGDIRDHSGIELFC